MKSRCAKSQTKYAVKALLAAVLFFLIVLSGCRKRQAVADQSELSPSVLQDATSELLIRILLEDNISSCSFESPASFTIICPNTPISKANFEKIKEPIKIEAREGRLFFGGWSCPGNETTICPNEPYKFTLNNSTYRGNLKLILKADTNNFEAINYVHIGAYLAGVIGAEMPSYWETAALEAQTVAARTYCLYIKNRFGKFRNWDLRRTQANQVYRGIAAESNRIWKVVNNTSGLVLTCKWSDDNYDIFPTYYSSSCAGHTENSENVFGDGFETLVGVACPYCKDVAKPKELNWPQISYSKSSVNEKLINRYPKLKELDFVKFITPAAQSDYQGLTRLIKIKLTGSNGKSEFLRAEDLRLAIDPSGFKIKSTSFEIQDDNDSWTFINGKGFGHGVGLCQCGAQGLARNKRTYEEILQYYYPNSKIKKIH